MRKVLIGAIISLLLLNLGPVLAAGKKIPVNSSGQVSAPANVLQARDQALERLQAVAGSPVKVRYGENQVPILLQGKLTKPAVGTKPNLALNFLSEYKELFLLTNPASELKLRSEKTDKQGNAHLKFDQVYQGIPVWGSQMVVHFHQDGYIKSVTGRWEPTPQLDVNPILTQVEAVEIAKQELKKDKFKKEPSADLIIFPWEKQTYLAWQVTLVPDAAHVWRYFVEAKSGRMILKYNDVKNDGPVTATGVDLGNNSVLLNAYVYFDTIYLADATKPMFVPPIDSGMGIIATFDAKNDTSLDNLELPIPDPNGDTVFNDNPGLKAGVSAHYNLGLVYDYFYNVLGRNSWDDNGSRIFSAVHYGTNFNNAFWNGDAVIFGDGDSIQFLPFPGSLDVTAHEFGHGVTEATADLIYLGEWGALNEHLSDFWGAMLDRDDWLIGEDIYLGLLGYIRNMENPEIGGQPEYMSDYYYYPSCNTGLFCDLVDNGGVHINSGIPNLASYLLATDITRDTTEQLYYQALVYYLVARSRFGDLRYALLNAADDLYASEANYANIVSSIESSFDSVGIYDLYALPDSELAFDDGIAYYIHPLGPDAGIDWSWAVRFTPHAPCSLLAVTAQFYNTGSNSWLQVYTDLEGMPDSLLLDLNVDRLVSYPNWQYIDLSAYDLFFDQDFYLAFSSTTLDSFLLSDSMLETNHLTFYISDLNTPGFWYLIEQNDGLGGDPLIRAVVSYQSQPVCVAVPGDVNGTPPIGLPDIIYLVNYVFDKDRPGTGCLGSDPGYCWEPDPVCRAEINGTPPAGLPDIVHLVNYVFDKDRPATGCLGVDPGYCWPPVATGVCCLPVP